MKEYIYIHFDEQRLTRYKWKSTKKLFQESNDEIILALYSN